MSVRLYDPVEAYDLIAPQFERLAEPRMRYLDRIDELVISRIPAGSRSLLDVGAGDGRRALRIAQARDLKDIVLLEPSQGMQHRAPEPARFLTLRAEQLQSLEGSFDVIICLWNVLGHIGPHAARVKAMRQLARLTSPQGRIFVDVNHRYNAARYGAARTALRFLYDWIHPGTKNGDVVVAWNVEGVAVKTSGHVFTHREFRSMVRDSGLTIEQGWVIDYETGQTRRFRFQGNLLYELRPALTAAG